MWHAKCRAMSRGCGVCLVSLGSWCSHQHLCHPWQQVLQGVFGGCKDSWGPQQHLQVQQWGLGSSDRGCGQLWAHEEQQRPGLSACTCLAAESRRGQTYSSGGWWQELVDGTCRGTSAEASCEYNDAGQWQDQGQIQVHKHTWVPGLLACSHESANVPAGACMAMIASDRSWG